MEQALELALEYAHQQNAQKILRLKMRIGAMSGVVPEALEFAFDIVTRDTLAEGAILEIEEVPVVCYCPNCNIEFQPAYLFYECPQCGELSSEVRKGKEIELASLELSE